MPPVAVPVAVPPLTFKVNCLGLPSAAEFELKTVNPGTVATPLVNVVAGDDGGITWLKDCGLVVSALLVIVASPDREKLSWSLPHAVAMLS